MQDVDSTRPPPLPRAPMKLLGDANWYLPRRLGWLPRLAHEPAEGAEPLQPSLDSIT